jgi:UDP-N-acetylmuramate--alanine ligase
MKYDGLPSNPNIKDLNPTLPVHLAGIAGSAMNGLAVLLKNRGFKVSGSDPRATEVQQQFNAIGIFVSENQDGSSIPKNAQLVIATAALPTDHPELVAARSRGINVVNYAEFLGALMTEREGIAVAGTHGKTTTTAMIVQILQAAKLDPGFVIGGIAPSIGVGAGNGSDPYFVAEACEYNRSFLNLYPRIAVVTNIEEDHLDIYKDLSEIKQTFIEFLNHLPASNGLLVYSADCPATASILKDINSRKLSCGIDQKADYTAYNLNPGPTGTSFDITDPEGQSIHVQLDSPGRHNVANALNAVAVCHSLAVPLDQCASALDSFSGVNRRFQVYNDVGNISFVDDYAHHPTEIRAVLAAARDRFPDRRLVIAFQPHQSSRTRIFLKELAEALSMADHILVLDIYSVRDSDEDQRSISSFDLVSKIRNIGPNAEYSGSPSTTVDLLSKLLRPLDVLISIGAGNVDQVIHSIVQKLA